MRPLRLSILCLLLVAAASLSGQDKPKTGVVLYRDRLAQQFDTVKVVKNVFKLNPLLFFRGEIPLYYERALTPNVSAELAVGFTTRNYIGNTLSGDDVDSFSRGTDILFRPSYHVGLRYYTRSDLEPQGLYVQFEFAHLEYVKDITVKGPTGDFTEEKLRDERVFDDLRLLLGFQQLAASSNWLFDFYGGLGLRSRDMTIVDEQLDLTNNQYTYSVEDQDDTVISVFLGVKVGLGF